jgi:hypothetical protein
MHYQHRGAISSCQYGSLFWVMTSNLHGNLTSVRVENVMIDLYKAIADLREQQGRVERAILAFEEMARLRKPRRGRPPKWLSSAAFQRGQLDRDNGEYQRGRR